jgi:hypothetical protein
MSRSGQKRFGKKVVFSPPRWCVLLASFIWMSVGTAFADDEVAYQQEFPMTDPAVEVPVLSGTWVQLTHQTSISNPAIIGEVTTETRTWSITQVVQNGDEVRMDSTVCSVDVKTSSRGIRTIIPQGMMEAMSIGSRVGRLQLHGDDYRLTFPRTRIVLGAELDDPENDALPDDDSDPRVYDQDGDGNPGVTVQIRGIVRGEIYLVQRAWSRLLSETVTSNRIEGQIQWHEESVILGATNPFLKMQPATRPGYERDQNYFVMQRAPEGVSCRDLQENPERYIER